MVSSEGAVLEGKATLSTAAFLLQGYSMRSWRSGTKKADVTGRGVIGKKKQL